MNSIHVQIWRLKVSNIQVGGTRFSLNHSFWQATCAVSYSDSPVPALALEPSCLCAPVSHFSEGVTSFRNPSHSSLASSLRMCNSLADKATFWKSVGQDYETSFSEHMVQLIPVE